jgi:hypothetical protein
MKKISSALWGDSHSMLFLWRYIIRGNCGNTRISLQTARQSMQLLRRSLNPHAESETTQSPCKHHSSRSNSIPCNPSSLPFPRSKAPSLFRLLNTLRNHRLDLENTLQQLLDNLVMSCLASLLDLLYLFLSILIRIFLSLLVVAGVL